MKVILLIIFFGITASSFRVLGQSPQLTQAAIGSKELAELIDRQVKQILESDNGDIRVEGRTIAASILAAAILDLSKRRETFLRISIEDCTIDGELKLERKRITIPLRFEQVIFKGELNCDGATFQESLGFYQNCRFEGRVSFVGANIHQIHMGSSDGKAAFLAEADFSKVTFTGDADFSFAVFSTDVLFEQATFKDVAYFRGASFLYFAHFGHAIFLDRTDFTSASFGEWLELNDATFEKEAVFNKAAFSKVGFFPNTVFKGKAEFGDARFEEAEFRNTAFSDDVSFNHTEFQRYAGFGSTRFRGEADFEGCRFPSRKSWPGNDNKLVGLYLVDTRFEKRVRLSFDQLLDGPSWVPFNTPSTKLESPLGDYRTVRVWENLEQTFQNANDLSSRNEAEYQRNFALAHLPETGRLQSIANWFHRIFWGYGVRPGRVLVWLCLTYSIFAFIYWTQTRQLSAHEKGIRWHWQRFVFALFFSWNTTYRLTYGYENSRTNIFRFLTLLQSLGSKVLLFFFIKALANTSPLISELVNKGLPR
jgi:uncharacterized protein YjbI with pentapeptide repeats